MTTRNYNNYSPERVRTDLQDVSWQEVYDCQDPNNAWISLKSTLRNYIDKIAPYTTKRIKEMPCPWLTADVKLEMNTRDQLLRKARRTKQQLDWDNFKRKRNYVTNLIRNAKNTYHQNLLEENSSRPEKFWKCIKTLFPTQQQNSSGSFSLNIDGTIITNKFTIANRFCAYFHDIARKLKIKFDPLKDYVWRSPPVDPKYPRRRFKLKYVSLIEVKKHLKSLKRKKTDGLDQIPTCLLKDGADFVAAPLAHLINLSLKTGIVPSEFKIGKIIPIFKSGQLNNIDNYRPITILPPISKILEKCVHSQFIDFLEEHKLLSSNQFGFRSKRSTELANILFIDNIRKAMDKGLMTGAVYIDLSKAFDTISHSAILSKLEECGAHSVENEWFCNYLFNRSQVVCIDGTQSSSYPVYCGVPQGSILGPLLFLIHFDGISNKLTKCKILMYADDTVIYVSHRDKEHIEKDLLHDLTLISAWLNDNELIMNLKKGKTESMLFGTGKRLSKLNSMSLSLKIGYTEINSTDHYKYLGVCLDPTLNLGINFEKICKKASSRLRLLAKIRPCITTKAALNIYQAFITPIITYCSLINTFSCDSRIAVVNKLQTRARLIIGCNRINGHNLTSFENYDKRKQCMFVYKCLSGELNDNFDTYFEPINHERNTQSGKSSLRLPRVRLEVAKKGCFFRSCKAFNCLSASTRSSVSLAAFKGSLKLLYC